MTLNCAMQKRKLIYGAHYCEVENIPGLHGFCVSYDESYLFSLQFFDWLATLNQQHRKKRPPVVGSYYFGMKFRKSVKVSRESRAQSS